MSDFKRTYPVDGSAALQSPSIRKADTRIISFPSDSRHPQHAKPDYNGSFEQSSSLAGRVVSFVSESDFGHAILHGTCAGKPVGKMTSFQTAAVCGAFFLFMLSTLLFV